MIFSSLIDTIANRRGAMRAMAGASTIAAGMAAMGSAPAQAAKAKRKPVDFKDPAQNLKSFIKITGDLDPTKESVGWFGGTIYGNRGVEALKPLEKIKKIRVLLSAIKTDVFL